MGKGFNSKITKKNVSKKVPDVQRRQKAFEKTKKMEELIKNLQKEVCELKTRVKVLKDALYHEGGSVESEEEEV